MRNFKKYLYLIPLFFLVLQGEIKAQATVTSRLGWDIAAPNLATAQAYTYKHYTDGSTTGVVITGVTCIGTASPFTCSIPFPAFTPGQHTTSISASNTSGEGSRSSILTFTFLVLPAGPTNLRILPGE